MDGIGATYGAGRGGGLYIHIPICASKCIYCDFYSVGPRNAPWRELVSAIIKELRLRRAELPRPLTTLYIGGGTPSLLPLGQLARLLSEVKALASDSYEVEEFTIEANPDDISAEYIDRLIALGVNRLSLGVQSFNDEELRLIRRRHTAAQALEAVVEAKRVGNVGLDLIFGLPGQTLDSWQATLAKALELRPHHISLYSLMYEKGTAIYAMRQQGRIAEVADDLAEKMYLLVVERLKAAGYRHYEISNFALPGRESRHNSSYWCGLPYLGLGPAAHSYDGKALRTANNADLGAYIKALCGSGQPSPDSWQQKEVLTEMQRIEEHIMTRLRTDEGINLAEFERLWGAEALRKLERGASRGLRAGQLELSSAPCGERTLRIAEEHWLTADALIVDLLP